MTKNSLREEIIDSIKKIVYDKPTWEDDYENISDTIISILEKRIDSILREEPHNTIDYAEGFAKACMKIKEMLK